MRFWPRDTLAEFGPSHRALDEVAETEKLLTRYHYGKKELTSAEMRRLEILLTQAEANNPSPQSPEPRGAA
jgi:hypothetical protein